MKTLIVCYSAHHNNTLTIARTIATILDADLLDPNDVDPETCTKNYDLIGFGSGIYAARHHQSLFDLVKKMPDTHANTFIFSTKALKFVQFYHNLLRSYLVKKGYLVLKEFSCEGFSTYGPLKLFGGMNKNHPDAIDILTAEKFANMLKTYSFLHGQMINRKNDTPTNS